MFYVQRSVRTSKHTEVFEFAAQSSVGGLVVVVGFEWIVFASQIQGSIRPHAIIILPNSAGTEVLVCYEDEGVYIDTYGRITKDTVLQWGEMPASVGTLHSHTHKRRAVQYEPNLFAYCFAGMKNTHYQSIHSVCVPN